MTTFFGVKEHLCQPKGMGARPSLTLMRPPVVKGQRYPLSGFLHCFPPG